MAETQHFEIEGHEFTLSPLMGRQALRLAHRLASYLSGLVPDNPENGNVSMREGLDHFFRKCSEKELESFAEAIFATLTMDNKPLSRDWPTVFMGRPGLMLKALIEATKVHFQDFFSMLESSDLLGQAEKTAKKPTLED